MIKNNFLLITLRYAAALSCDERQCICYIKHYDNQHSTSYNYQHFTTDLQTTETDKAASTEASTRKSKIINISSRVLCKPIKLFLSYHSIVGINFHGNWLREDVYVRAKQYFHSARWPWHQNFSAKV